MASRDVRGMSVGTKLFLIVLVTSIASFAVTAWITRRAIHEESVENLVAKARAITSEAENARQYVAELRSKHDAFANEKMLAELKEAIAGAKTQAEIIEKARTASFYYTIPVVAAWTVAETNAQKAGYKFKVPKIQPRNPKNEPDAVEREMLEELAATKKEEVWRIDEATNSLRYMKPVVLSQDCMICHGTEKDYPEGKGYDPLGIKMEGWAVGDVRGGFEVIADLAPMQSRTASASMTLISLGAVMIGITGALLFLLIRKLVSKPLVEAVGVLDAVANGDLTRSLKNESNDEVGRMSTALDNSLTRLRDTLKGVDEASRITTTASQELTSAAESLSSSVQEQAASLEETSASLAEMTSTAKTTAAGAQEANKSALESKRAAEEGSQVVMSTIEAMKKIDESSKRIGAITTTINEIAFQTNLLSLNAAVEAARAGAQGSGFAVVAAEVRNLALRSAQAAKEIKVLIDESAKNVKDGADLAQQSGKTLGEIIGSVTKVTSLVDGIATAASEQSRGIDQINKAVAELGRTVQSNAAQNEQLSATARNLLDQSEQLKSNVSRFVLDA